MRVLARVLLLPALLAASVAALFHRAFATDDLVPAAVAAAVLGSLVGWLAASVRPRWVAGPVAGLAGLLGGAVLVSGQPLASDLVPDAFVVFLTVGLPAGGLDQLAVVPFTVLYAATAVSVFASVRGRTLLTLAGPVAAAGVTALFVDPVGFDAWLPALLAVAAGGVLVVDVRNDLGQLPPLVGTSTELRRQLVWWRPLVHAVPVLAVVLVVGASLPHPDTFDVRDHVELDAEQVVDPNPLAVAAVWQRVPPADAAEVARLRVEDESPGRLRIAVLDEYTDTGWRQSAAFGITGDTLAADPVYAHVPRPEDGIATVTVEPVAGDVPFRGLPTGGVPVSVADPGRVRYAPAAGMLLASDQGAPLTYRAAARAASRGEVVPNDPPVGEFPHQLAACPASPNLSAVAAQLAEGTVDPTERLRRIENYLKLRRVYDPAAPGGQTIGSVEDFVSLDFGRGNLEVFVTTYALLARCAGVPVRVVVGFPAPPVGESELREHELTAWVETPLATSGWVPHDPLPTPEEQLQQAQLAQQPDPPPPDDEPEADEATPPREVVPIVPGAGGGTDWRVVAPLAALALALVAALLWSTVGPRLVVRRRRRVADPTAAVHAAWVTVADAVLDREIGLDDHHTPSEVVRLAAGRLPLSVPRLLQGLAPIVDRARYSGIPVGEDDAGLAWAYADAILSRLPATRASRLAPLRHPSRAATRLRSAFGVPLRDRRWAGTLPPSAIVTGAEAPDDVPHVTIEARIGEGSTGTVFRGLHDVSGEHVAVKVFRYGPGDAGFDPQRFDWEVRVAQEVSGLPHLPVVHGAGITPSGRPYLVSGLHEGGTLLDRVHRGGPMSQGEAVAIGYDLALALDTLHQLGVVHADVKPENVFSGSDGWVLGDLGSAWLRASRGPAATLTPPYAAPEVWRGASPTAASDLYSLALTLLFAATGQVPIAGNPPTNDDVVAAFPDHPVLLRALDADPRRRPRTVADLARQLRPDLAPALAGSPLTGLSLPTPTVSHRG